MSAPISPGEDLDALVALESLISPGKRSRLSPYVESAQLATLFGEAPEVGRHSESVARVVAANQDRVDVSRFAWETWRPPYSRRQR